MLTVTDADAEHQRLLIEHQAVNGALVWRELVRASAGAEIKGAVRCAQGAVVASQSIRWLTARHREGEAVAFRIRDVQAPYHRLNSGCWVGGIADGKLCRGGAHRRGLVLRGVERFEVATGGAGDLGVGIPRTHSHRIAVTRGAAHWNGDGLTVVQPNDQIAASHRVAHRGDVDNRAALGDRRGGRQGHGGDIGIVVDHAGRTARALDVERLEVATDGAGDLGADAQGTLGVDVIGAHDPRRTVARQAALGNGDGLAVVQRDDQITSSNPVAHRSGVDNRAALGDRRGGRQGHDAGQRFVPHEQQPSGVKRIVLLISQPGQRQGIERPFQNEPASTRFVQRQQLLNEQLRRDGQIGSAQHHDHGCVRAQYRVGANRQQEGAARIEQTQRVVEC